MYPLTDEQLRVIKHPRSKHARVLAVAGSGKTTTMVYRIQHLVRDLNINPRAVLVLMFNKLARKQFKEKLAEVGIKPGFQPPVHTFHSFADQFTRRMVADGLLPAPLKYWTEDKAEIVRICTHKAIENLVNRRVIPLNSVDPEDVIEAIGLWKGSLIPPLADRAGHRHNPHIPAVYVEFERLRINENALTFDDFVPMAVGILESERSVSRQWCNRYEFIVADEYQDVNFGQQRLIELLAGQRADVMVVGDDDQTIYEWRGARPSYIIREFERIFANKPHVDYTLSRSFRFGPTIAQCAENVISINRNRKPKDLLAHSPKQHATLSVLSNSSEQGTDATKELAQRVIALVRETKDPRNVIVLCRTHHDEARNRRGHSSRLARGMDQLPQALRRLLRERGEFRRSQTRCDEVL